MLQLIIYSAVGVERIICDCIWKLQLSSYNQDSKKTQRPKRTNTHGSFQCTGPKADEASCILTPLLLHGFHFQCPTRFCLLRNCNKRRLRRPDRSCWWTICRYRIRPRQALQLHPYSSLIHMYAGVFTSLTRKLGVKHLEIVEVYDIEPWAVDHLHPYGLVFCFRWRKDTHRPTDFKDPAAEHVWFANQLSDDACASQAILNILFNCSNVDIGTGLSEFKEYTREMSPKVSLCAATSRHSFRRYR